MRYLILARSERVNGLAAVGAEKQDQLALILNRRRREGKGKAVTHRLIMVVQGVSLPMSWKIAGVATSALGKYRMPVSPRDRTTG
jgi:hypothetical protein